MNVAEFQSLIAKHNISTESVTYLMQQGIELERLKLEVHRETKCDSVQSHIIILEGERLVSLLSFPLDLR